jgi:hypothetical protein
VGYLASGGYTLSGTTWQGFNGYISNLRLVKSALYAVSFTPSTTPLTAIANTSLLTCQDPTIKDNSTNAYTLTVTNSPQVKTLNPFGQTTTTKVAYSPSTHGGSVYFDGTGDYLQGTVAAPGTDDFTMEGWVYFTAIGVGSVNIFSIVASGSSSGWQVYGSSNYFWGLRNNGINITTGTGTVVANTWYHVAVVRKSAVITLYLNGTYLSSTSTVYNFTDTQFNAGYTPIGTAMTGYVSDIRYVKGTALYTSNFYPPLTSLTSPNTAPANLLLNCNNAAIMDQRASNNLETAGNVQLSTSVKKFGTASIYFDGTGDNIRMPSSPNFAINAVDFTIEFWIYPTSLAAQFTVVDFRGAMNNVGFTDYIGTNGKINLFQEGGSTYLTTTGTISANVWTHIAYVRSNGTIKVYINGAADPTTASNTTNWLAPNGFAFIGSNYVGSNYLPGYLDDFRITKYARYLTNFTLPSVAMQTK